LIPASGYYEWLNTLTGKQPYYYTARNGSPLTIAGLWDEWNDIETGEPLKSCTMIITNANDLASKIHNRMPVLLQPKDFGNWLTGTAGTELLKPAPNDHLQTWLVSRRVNSSRAASDDPTLIDPVAA
jgi:putative SOS response-associated peptidase YedK